MRILDRLKAKLTPNAFKTLMAPAMKRLPEVDPLMSRGDRPLQMTFENELNAMVYYHLGGCESGLHLLQDLEENDFAKEHVAPVKGIKKSAFFEALNTRGAAQFSQLFSILAEDAAKILPDEYAHLGNCTAIDGSLIDSVLSMEWAEYRGGMKKAKVHIGFNINRGIPTKIFLTDGKGAERPFVEKIVEKGETAVCDRGYQCSNRFDQWHNDGKLYACRIKKSAIKQLVRENVLIPGSIAFYDAAVLLGTKGAAQTKEEVRVVGYRVGAKKFWVATNRHDLSADDVALVYKLRWAIESFFAWWKRHLKVYHLIARTKHGLMVQILGGLITFLLLSIYCRVTHGERVSLNRLRELRNLIRNEAAELLANKLIRMYKMKQISRLRLCSCRCRCLAKT